LEDFEPLLGRLALEEKQPDEALRHFNRALLARPIPDLAARQTALLASSGYYQQALSHLDYYEQIKPAAVDSALGMAELHQKVLEWEGYWPFELGLLKKKLHAAIAERDGHPP
jgi:tetratricopeptide (TPR) repeat protein